MGGEFSNPNQKWYPIQNGLTTTAALPGSCTLLGENGDRRFPAACLSSRVFGRVFGDMSSVAVRGEVSLLTEAGDTKAGGTKAQGETPRVKQRPKTSQSPPKLVVEWMVNLSTPKWYHWFWVKIMPGMRQRVLVICIYQGNPFWVPSVGPHPAEGPFFAPDL